MAIIGANTEPMRYKNPVISSIGNTIAPMVPTTVTATATYCPLNCGKMDSLEIPAE